MLSSEQRNKLVKLLSLTASDNDHEALSAIRACNRMLKDNDTDWQRIIQILSAKDFMGDALKRKPNPEPRKSTPLHENRAVIATLLKVCLTQEPNNLFFISLSNSFDSFGKLTVKQFDSLYKNYEKFRS